MAANANEEYKVFKYYEGLCSSADFTKEIAKVLALGVRSQAVKDIDGNVLTEPQILKSKNWDIVYPAPDSSLNIDTNNLTTEEYKKKILNQVNKISDTVILKTTTTPKPLIDSEYDDLTVGGDTNKSDLTMYLEIYKPTYLANPEEYPLDCERHGITPKLITKDLYQESLQTSHADIKNICAGLTPDIKVSTTNGTVDLSSVECDNIVKKINDVYGNVSFSLPTDISSTSQTINSSYLAKIKQENAELYSFICNSLNSGEGIEPKEYTLLESVQIEIVKNNDIYTMSLEGKTNITTYHISAGDSITVDKTPIEALTPEYYLDGIYTPIDNSLYHADEKTVYFDADIEFEASKQGILVIRYNYETSGQSIISERKSLLNNHYVLMRMFDSINEEGNGPAENVYNTSGDIVQTNSHISPWSKLSWYQDFEEVMIDTIDADVSVTSLHDGTVVVPLETPGLNADTQMRYWINTNNDRFSLIVMGNPSLDYTRDRHLISACYCGRIDSFDNSINDTAGNFALFTSSSTEPCNTTLNTEKNVHEMTSFVLDDIAKYDSNKLTTFMEKCPYHTPCNGLDSYVIQLTDNNYFDLTTWPKYIIIDKSTGIPVTTYTAVQKRKPYMNNGKADVLQITIDSNHKKYDGQYEIYINFGSYKESYSITSGVSRDVFGNVIDVDKIKDYGNNTSDGVTSIMMYHTRSRAYYQKHHMLFATTEEYMSKVMYGKSSYTGEYYADRIKVTHSNDGPRGTLSDLLVIDSSSLYALDELVINKDFEKDPYECEETFVYFPITAPYSPLSDSPNARYGLAIKKKEVEPTYTDELKILKIAVNELGTLVNNLWWPVETDIYPQDTTSNGCEVYWKVLDDTAWIGSQDNLSDYVPIKLVVTKINSYAGDTNTPLAGQTVQIAKGSTKADKTTSYVKITGFQAENGEKLYYGISDTAIEDHTFNKDEYVRVILKDGAEDNTEEDTHGGWNYGIEGVPCTGELKTDSNGDSILIDAAPNKYLVLYSVKEGETAYTMTKYACAPLKEVGKDENELLQYPCTVNVLIENGTGHVFDSTTDYKNAMIEYNTSIDIPFLPDNGYKITKAVVIYDNDESTKQEITEFEQIGANKGIKLANVTRNVQVKVSFTKE